MNLLDRAIGYVSPAAGLRRQQARQHLAAAYRSYDAAKPSRATAGWRRPWTSSRSETYVALPWLKASSHDLVRNDPHSAKLIATLANDIVGATGLMPRANTGNKRLNKKIDNLAKRYFRAMDADGITPSFGAYQLLLVRSFLEGGEAISRRYIQPSELGLEVPVQFSLMEGEFLDNLKNSGGADGNTVCQGIEFDRNKRRVAYHLFKDHPGDVFMGSLASSGERIRVPAADIRLLYEPQRAGQLRGVPWITPILLRARQLSDYEDAERRRKQLESSMPTIVHGGAAQTGDGNDPTTTSLFPTLVDGDGNLVEKVEAGIVGYTRDGTTVETIKPADAMGYAPYKRAELQSIAAGGRSTYEVTSGDLSQTNFSSIQFGMLTYRGMVDVVRAHMVIPHLAWIWGEMIAWAVFTGALPAGTSDDAEWHCPPWLPIDPEKQANADLTDIRSGKKTLKQIVVASGRDFDDHLDEQQSCNKALDRRGIVLDSDPRHTDRRGVLQQLAPNVKGDAPPASSGNPDQA